jgi:hypothetical protein
MFRAIALRRWVRPLNAGAFDAGVVHRARTLRAIDATIGRLRASDAGIRTLRMRLLEREWAEIY